MASGPHCPSWSRETSVWGVAHVLRGARWRGHFKVDATFPHVTIELSVVDRASLDLATLASRVGPGASPPRLYGRSVSYSTSGMLSDQLGCPVRLAPQAPPSPFSTLVNEAKKCRRSARISSKHQVTIPLDAMRNAGLEAAERAVARAEGPGRVVLEREEDVLSHFAGALTVVFQQGELEALRGESG